MIILSLFCANELCFLSVYLLVNENYYPGSLSRRLSFTFSCIAAECQASAVDQLNTKIMPKCKFLLNW